MHDQVAEIFRVSLRELSLLEEISTRTFKETFAAQNTEENMRRYIETELSEEKLKSELSDPDMQFYFAHIDQSIVGYLKVNLSQAQTELKDARALEIERIYVLKEYHGKKVAQQLYEKAVQIAEEAEVDYIWLGVWEENHRAIRFYEKMGFLAFDKHIFQLGDDAQTDIMMKLDLQKHRILPKNK
jgi:ribosomal protein S18 acetylase RimI-like enzyme